MYRPLGTLLAVAAGLAWGCATGGPSAATDPGPDPLLAAAGADLFQKHCASCHGTAARGDGPAAPALRTRPADLRRIAARRGGRFPEAEISRYVDGRFELPAHGTREMPIWGERLAERIPELGYGDEVARGRILSLVEYLRTIQEK